MQPAGRDLIGKKISVRDQQTGDLIADTKINSYDLVNKIMHIGACGVLPRRAQKVQVLVFADGGVYEYIGNLRRSFVSNEMEIALCSQAKKKEERRSRRLTIKERGVVDKIRIEGQWVTLRKPIPILTINISSNGILIRTIAGSFSVKDQIQVAVRLKSGMLRSNYEICRVVDKNTQTEQYGCRLMV